VIPAAVERRRILVVDDQPVMRLGVAYLLNTTADLTAAGEAGTAAQALNLISARLPDLVLTELTLPDRSGIDLIRDLGVFHPRLLVVVYSSRDETLHGPRALRAGARGYVMKRESGERLLGALRQVLSGRRYVSDGLSDRIVEGFSAGGPRDPAPAVSPLSQRESEIFEQIACGLGTRELAARLNISVKTAEAHRASIKRKLGLRNATELVREAVRWLEVR